MSTNFMYIPETVIFIKSAKLDAQKHWQITVEMKSFILEQGFDKDYLHVKGKSEQKGEESTNHTSYSVLRDIKWEAFTWVMRDYMQW